MGKWGKKPVAIKQVGRGWQGGQRPEPNAKIWPMEKNQCGGMANVFLTVGMSGIHF